MSDHSTPKSSRLRNASNASTNSSAYSSYSNPFPPSRTSTVSSAASSGYQFTGAGHKRGISEASGMAPSTVPEVLLNTSETGQAGTYKSMRQSLRPLPQPPGALPPATRKAGYSPQACGQSVNISPTDQVDRPIYSPTSVVSQQDRPYSMALSRSDSVIPVPTASHRLHAHHTHLTKSHN